MSNISDYLHAKASKRRIPLSATFELSPVCNFKCKMCYVRSTNEQILAQGKKLKDWKEWLEIARECKKEGTLNLLLTGGEPFLYPNFRELYTELHKEGFLIAINTNGSLVDKETIEWLKTMAPARINITLYGGNPDTYERICANRGGYDKAVQAITGLKEAGIPVVINASMIPENADDLESIINFGKSLGINTRVSTYMFPPVRREKESDDSRFNAEEAAHMYLRKHRCLFDNEQDFYSMIEGKLESLEKLSLKNEEDWGNQEQHMRCRAGRSSFWISWNGAMSACGMVPFPIEVYPFEEGFRKSWDKLTDAVRTATVLKECSRCNKKEICSPCAAMLYSETGDENKKSEYLCEMSECIIKEIKEILSKDNK